jgi:hypothetical protein
MMEAIKTYIDNVFSAYEPSERVEALKREMLASMEEKYHELKRQGKSEHEAIGGVIANFGSMDEITAELGLGLIPEEGGLYLNEDEVDEYLVQSRKSGFWIGLGIWFILAGAAGTALVAILTDEAWSALILFGALAVAVPIFIKRGMQANAFKHYTKQKIHLDPYIRSQLQERRTAFNPQFYMMVSIGVIFIFAAVGSAVILQYDWVGAVFLFAIGFSNFLFISTATVKYAFDALLGEGQYKNKRGFKKADRLTGTIAAIYWPLVVAVFLIWNFAGDTWGDIWIIWPIAAVIFGAIVGGIHVWQSGKSE